MAKRRLKSTGSIYRRQSDGRWVATVEQPRLRDEPRRRKTTSSQLYCQTLKRLNDLEPMRVEDAEQRSRAAYMEAAKAQGSHSAREWYERCKAVKCHCEYCGVRCRPVKDHRTPVSRGGSDSIDNIAVSCWRCNNLKFAMTEDEYRDYLKRNDIGPGWSKPIPRRAS